MTSARHDGVSAIVVTFHTGPILEACLAALRACPDVGDIVVVNNGNPEPAVRALQALAREGQVRLLDGHGNIGFARACNLGAVEARGEAFLFINPDCVIAPGAVAALRTARAQAGHGPVVVGGRIVNADGGEQRGGRRDTVTLWRAAVSFSGLSRLEAILPVLRDVHREKDPLPGGPVPVGAVSGALMFLRRADFDALGGFDGGYFLHVEDLDICRRAHVAGGEVWFAPQAQAAHARSTSDAPAAAVQAHKAAGFRRYFLKFARSPFERLAARMAAPLIGLALRARGARGLSTNSEPAITNRQRAGSIP